MQKQHRPRGVTIIAILSILGGIISISEASSSTLGFVGLASGIASIVAGYGLWKAKRWAWPLTIILMFIGIGIGVAVAIGSLSTYSGYVLQVTAIIIGIAVAINAIIIYYLYRPYVKEYFGRSSVQY